MWPGCLETVLAGGVGATLWESCSGAGIPLAWIKRRSHQASSPFLLKTQPLTPSWVLEKEVRSRIRADERVQVFVWNTPLTRPRFPSHLTLCGPQNEDSSVKAAPRSAITARAETVPETFG